MFVSRSHGQPHLLHNGHIEQLQEGFGILHLLEVVEFEKINSQQVVLVDFRFPVEQLLLVGFPVLVNLRLPMMWAVVDRQGAIDGPAVASPTLVFPVAWKSIEKPDRGSSPRARTRFSYCEVRSSDGV